VHQAYRESKNDTKSIKFNHPSSESLLDNTTFTLGVQIKELQLKNMS